MNRATDGGTSRFNCAGTAARASSQSGVGRVQSSMPVSYGVAVTLVVTHLHNGRQGGLADSHTEARKHLERKFERLHFRGDLAKRDRGLACQLLPCKSMVESHASQSQGREPGNHLFRTDPSAHRREAPQRNGQVQFRHDSSLQNRDTTEPVGRKTSWRHQHPYGSRRSDTRFRQSCSIRNSRVTPTPVVKRSMS